MRIFQQNRSSSAKMHGIRPSSAFDHRSSWAGSITKVTHRQTKDFNRTLVFQTIYAAGQHPISRADVARLTALTRTTVSEIVRELLSEGLVEESGKILGQSGKPAIRLHMAANACQMIALDLTGSAAQGALLDLHGQILARASEPLGDRAEESFQIASDALVRRLMASATSKVLGIGVGVQGSWSGVMEGSRRLPRAPGEVLGSWLGMRWKLPVHVGQPSHFAAVAEHSYGNCSQTSNLVLIHVGDRISSGILMEGRSLWGSSSQGDEIGHLCVEKNGPLCRCGSRGCLEAVASGPAMLENARTKAREFSESPFGQAMAKEDASLDTLRMLFREGDPHARKLILAAAGHLGTAVANLAGIMSPRKVVLSGEVVGFGETFLDQVRLEVGSRIPPAWVPETEITFATFSDDLVIKGASAWLVLKELGLS